MPATRDPYKALWSRQEGVRRRDQEGLPQARAPVPPGPQPGRRARRGALQGGPGGLRDPVRRPRSARTTTPTAASSPVLGGSAPRRLGRGGFGGFGDILSDLFGSGGRAGGAGAGRARARPETEVHLSFEQAMEGAQVPVSVPLAAQCPTARHRREAGHGARRSAPAARSRHRAAGRRACSRSRSRARSAAAGHGDQGPLPDLQRRGPTRQVKTLQREHPRRRRDGSRVRLAGKGEAGPRGGPSGRPLRGHAVAASPLQARGRPPRGRGADHDRGGHPRHDGRGADAGRRQAHRVPAGTQHGTVQRLRGEGPPKLGGRGRGDIHYRLHHRRPPLAPREQSRRSTPWPT